VKTFYKILVVLAIILFMISGFLLYRLGYSNAGNRYNVLVDSLNTVLAQKPDTLWLHDTVFTDPIIKWRENKVPVPYPVYDTIYIEPVFTYWDTLVNDEVAFYVEDTIQGALLSRRIGYELYVPKYITNTVTVTEKVPFIVKEPLDANVAFYGGVMIPFNRTAGGIGTFVDVTIPKGYIFGGQYFVVDGNSYIGVKAGMKF
jgi:hypothetical protein